MIKRWKALDELECVKEHGHNHKMAHLMGTYSISKCMMSVGKLATKGFLEGLEARIKAAPLSDELLEQIEELQRTGIIKVEVPETRFKLEYAEEPALVFVSADGKHNERLFVNGEEVKGWRSITIRAGVDEFTTHEIEYVTAATK